jgi:DNA-binding transcriptional LysR family regulator
LRTVLAVADARHFRLAAERLHLTQPAVSRHAAELEAELGSSITLELSAPLSPLLVTRPLVPNVRRAIMLVRRRDHSLSPAAARVWAHLRDLTRGHLTKRKKSYAKPRAASVAAGIVPVQRAYPAAKRNRRID